MSFPIKNLPEKDFPRLLKEIPQPPKELNYRGQLPPKEMRLLTVVGSRRYTNYGKQVVEHLMSGLRGYNIGIVSGLALGIDSIAHQAALDNHLYTLSIPGSGLDDKVIYPARHKRLATQILESGGGLLSEFPPEMRANTWTFPQRNRLVCGIAEATLIIEANSKSGSLITARLAAEYNRELLVVPGSIFSENSRGTHQFLKLGATAVTEPSDILDILNIKIKDKLPLPATPELSDEENKIMAALKEPTERDALIRKLSLSPSAASVLLMQMEINGHIVEDGGVYRRT